MTPGDMQRLLGEAQATVTTLGLHEAFGLHESESTLFVDVREDHERAMGYIPGSSHLSLAEIQMAAQSPQDEKIADLPKDKKLIVYCAVGMRSLIAAKMLQDQGYEDVANLADGIQGWLREGGKIECS